MCGICGVYNNLGNPIDREQLELMTEMMEHRGPDGAGYFVDREVGLGHRRLSIIDLKGGAQPISNENGQFQVIFNGEIYNFIELRKELEAIGHKFKTNSDTEVIIHAYEQWGLHCVNRFNGIFSFAIFDIIKRELFLGRDHLGVKPLYFVNTDGQFLFASEIKALIQNPNCPREVDIEALYELFTFRYVPSPKTLFKGVFKLPPGHTMLVNKNAIKMERYWNKIPRFKRTWNEQELIEEYQTLLEDAVRLQMRSDVPVGLFLSSGVDSGALLAIMSKYSSGFIQTFTVGFEGGEKTNEVRDAHLLAEMFGAKHHSIIINHEDYRQYLDRINWDLEEPVGHEAAGAFYFLSKLTSERVKVALTGQGADEPWAGYDRYLGVKLSEYYSRLPSPITDLISTIVTRTPGRFELLKRGVVSLAEPDILTRFVKIYSFFSEDMKQQLFKKRFKFNGEESRTKRALLLLQSDVKQLDPLTQMLYIDTRASLPDDLLMVGDKTSMANSLEVRVPFLDYRLIEFVESLPPKLRLNGITGKYLHKKAIEKWLPKNVICRKKKGFDNPVADWFRTNLQSFIEDCLLVPNSAAATFFNQSYIRNLIEQDRQGKNQFRRHIYLLLSFELWHKAFIK